MDEIEAAAVEESIREIERMTPADLKGGSAYNELIATMRLDGLDPGLPHIRAAPMFEVFKVSIGSAYPPVADGKPCKVYGIIAALCDDGDVYLLYNRSKSDAEVIRLGDPLSLDDHPFSPLKPLKLFVYLRDKSRDVQIAFGHFRLDFSKDSDYDGACQVQKVDGEHGFATVKYNAFQSAHMAHVSVQLKKLKNDGKMVRLYGSISAHFGENYTSKLGDLYENHFLFKRNREESVKVRSGGFIKLSRTRVAVPANTSVSVAFDLWEYQAKSEICREEVDINAFECGTNDRIITVGNYKIEVEVQWSHPYKLLDRYLNKVEMGSTGEIEKVGMEDGSESLLSSLSPLHRSITSCLDRESDSDATEEPKHAKQPVWPTGCRRSLKSKHPLGVPLVEVFSVLVDCASHGGGGILGFIRVHDNLGTSFLFKRDDKDPEILSQNVQVLSTSGPDRCYMCDDDFRLDVKLRDVEGHVLGKGYMEWGADMLKGYVTWSDRHNRSLIFGDQGYTAVHYTIFSSGVQAQLKVLVSNDEFAGVGAKIHGSIVARYSNYDYSTYYDSEFFQILFFKASQEKPVHLNSGSEVEVPLRKYCVSAPSDSSLIVKLDLTVESHEGGTGVLQQVGEFEAFCDNSQTYQASGGFCITICVEWSTVSGDSASSCA